MEDEQLDVTDPTAFEEPAGAPEVEQRPWGEDAPAAARGARVGELHHTIEEYHRLGVDVQGDVYLATEDGERVPVGEYVTEPDGRVYVRTHALAPRDPAALWMRVVKTEE